MIRSCVTWFAISLVKVAGGRVVSPDLFGLNEYYVNKGNDGGFMKNKCYSKDDFPTVPWQFLLSSFPFPGSSLFLQQGVNLNFKGYSSLLWLLLIMSHKKLVCT